jgi:hypothetical protein
VAGIFFVLKAAIKASLNLMRLERITPRSTSSMTDNSNSGLWGAKKPFDLVAKVFHF